MKLTSFIIARYYNGIVNIPSDFIIDPSIQELQNNKYNVTGVRCNNFIRRLS